MNTQSLLRVGIAFGLLVSASACASTGVAIAPKTSSVRSDCPGGNADSEAALAAYRGCRTVHGDLSVSGVSNVAALAALESVSGVLSIAKTGTSSLAGLSNLRRVGALNIHSNPKLEDISALSTLHSARSVSFVENDELSSPVGLSGLSELDRLSLERTSFLNLSGLENLRRIGELRITKNAKLISLKALQGVTQVATLSIEQNRRVCGSLGLLGGLEAAPQVSVIRNNPTLFPFELKKLQTSSSVATQSAPSRGPARATRAALAAPRA